jgi:hypothetical protein
MAKDKKSFLLYCDIIYTVSKMPDDKAGQLFKHILEYVNDMNPQTDDLIIQLSFEPIKQQLKRDLQQYYDRCAKNKENINKRWNTIEYDRINGNTNHTDNDTDTDTDNDTVLSKKDKEKDIYIESGHLSITWGEMNNLIDKYGEELSDDIIKRILNYRKNTKYKSLYLTADKWLKKELAANEAKLIQNKSAMPKLAI